ncbi:hypothetical protein MMUR_55340 [Mycolicibacterium murale]|uniref:HTTM domain-containing protein n=2 Tax=Mycolicibacterium murale TaxID=182220 RepID=A0A7I9WVG4_9MYCO|nr:hypothetical protein MMUR_55340 [Mycolicibacterium murale]
MIAFAFFTAAAIKAATGWLEPGIEATRYYIVSDLLYSDPGPMASWILGINSPLLWKFLDYSTLFVEGCLILAVFFPGLFRIGLVLASVFHVGVFLTLGISFEMHAFVYLGFFLLPFAKWFPEIELLRDMKSRRRRAPTIAS